PAGRRDAGGQRRRRHQEGAVGRHVQAADQGLRGRRRGRAHRDPRPQRRHAHRGRRADHARRQAPGRHRRQRRDGAAGRPGREGGGGRAAPSPRQVGARRLRPRATMPPMAELTNDFSWSRSRDGAFQECKRKYYYHYYGAWGGWDAAASEEVRRLYILKQLASRQQWAGRVVHDAVEMALHAFAQGRDIPVEPFIADVIERMRGDWSDARLEAIREQLRLSIRSMKAYLADPEANVAAVADFEKTEDLRICRWCNFRAVCRPEL